MTTILHSAVQFEDAYRNAVGVVAGLRGAAGRTQDPDDQELVAAALDLRARVKTRMDRAGEHLRSLPNDVIRECREGRQTWPDHPGDPELFARLIKAGVMAVPDSAPTRHVCLFCRAFYDPADPGECGKRPGGGEHRPFSDACPSNEAA